MNDTETSEAIDVVCALIESEQDILIAKRKNGNLAGKWEFPGGKIGNAETEKEAIVREIEEELGCKINPLVVMKSNRHSYPNLTVNLIPIICELIEGQPKALEHEEIRWVQRGNIKNFDWADADIPILENYLACKQQAQE